jgi:glycosyltransferase involved in cell wall biosynthesis
MTQLSTTYPIPDSLPPVIIHDASLPLVSIVTPSYNQGRFIRETIDSILTQDYPNLEYWVIDGGSSDETVSILKEYEHDPRFHYVSEPDKGQSDALNKGLVRCRGEIFAWLNSDDVYCPNILRAVVTAWQTQERPALIYGLGRFIDQESNDLGYCSGQAPNMTLEKLLMFGKYHMAQPAIFFPKDQVLEAGGMDLSLHYTMDYDLLLKLAEKMDILHVPQDIALYRLHSDSKTVLTGSRFADDLLIVMDRAVQRGILPEKEAKSRVHLFAARIYFTPESWNFFSGLKSLQKGVLSNRDAAAEALSIFFKVLLRFSVGEKNWSKMRFIQMKIRESV